jgi:hypothetical protein
MEAAEPPSEEVALLAEHESSMARYLAAVAELQTFGEANPGAVPKALLKSVDDARAECERARTRLWDARHPTDPETGDT